MLYREVGQFKTNYNADQAIFPIRQDLIVVISMIAIAYLAIPFLASEYWFEVILLPILVFSLAALGLNVLTGYCGQISLGTGGFMAVGAYAAFKMSTAFPDMNVIVIFLISGLFAAAAGIVFGIPSLRIKGFYLAVATLASQFFFEWLFQKVGWFSNYAPSGTIGAPHREFLGVVISGPRTAAEFKYLVALTFLVFFCIIVKNLTRGYLGRSMMAIRDMDIAAEIIGIRPLRTKLIAFAVSSYIIGVAGALWLFLVQGNLEADAFDILTMSFPDSVHGDRRRTGNRHGLHPRRLFSGHDAGADQELSGRRIRRLPGQHGIRCDRPPGEVRFDGAGFRCSSPLGLRSGS